GWRCFKHIEQGSRKKICSAIRALL
ncbi:uncharacterized protein METZ01_LOCUS458945, partial [marine metagenome]